jgi:hypothetical protein
MRAPFSDGVYYSGLSATANYIHGISGQDPGIQFYICEGDATKEQLNAGKKSV